MLKSSKYSMVCEVVQDCDTDGGYMEYHMNQCYSPTCLVLLLNPPSSVMWISQ